MRVSNSEKKRELVSKVLQYDIWAFNCRTPASWTHVNTVKKTQVQYNEALVRKRHLSAKSLSRSCISNVLFFQSQAKVKSDTLSLIGFEQYPKSFHRLHDI